jgi:hypothetical protein
VQQAIQKKRPGKLPKIVLMNNKARPHTKKATLVTIFWELMNHSPYSYGLPPSDIRFDQGGGQKFQTDYKHERSVLNWLRSRNKDFHAVGVSNLSRRWKKCIVAYLLKAKARCQAMAQ